MIIKATIPPALHQSSSVRLQSLHYQHIQPLAHYPKLTHQNEVLRYHSRYPPSPHRLPCLASRKSSDAVTSDEKHPIFVSEKRSEGDIFERAATTCSIVNVSSTVNCRSGPGTSYPVVGQTFNGEKFVFKCYKRGTCVSGNCTWEYMPEHGCYISGYYTSILQAPVLLPTLDSAELVVNTIKWALVFGFYQKPFFDPTENYEESRQFSINDKTLFMQMEYCPAGGPMFEYGMRNSNSEAVIFIYHISERQGFLGLPSVFERACNSFIPQAATPKPGQSAFEPGLVRRLLSRLHLRHLEARPPPPVMVLAVSDMDSKSPRTRQVTTEEGEAFSRAIGAIFLEVSCSRYTGIANPKVKDDAMRELSKRVILKRACAEEFAKKARAKAK
ncbi:hypothetical protein V499_08262 [Pseudogymnoascus sp. VKM F-103]|nr:hypothetical protein V499_08262 [Pseudogymnoascus sp. VKM F-103]